MPSLTQRINVSLTPHEMVGEMLPPRRFAAITFANYLPDPEFPSQARAKAQAERFVAGTPSGDSRRSSVLWRRRESNVGLRSPRNGLYLDGGFGVGKTHLLVALFGAFPGKKAYMSFSDLTYFVGAVGFQTALASLAELELLAIDEFELDDPGDTVLISNLSTQLADRGVRLAVTSNTLPDRLGEDRFTAQDFLREIQGLASRFEIVKMDGPDYRHRNFTLSQVRYLKAEELAALSEEFKFEVVGPTKLNQVLSQVHPSKYRRMLSGLTALGIGGMEPFSSQATALRFVAFVDRIYELEIRLGYSGISLEEMFPAAFMSGGYRLKFGRTLSRLFALLEESVWDGTSGPIRSKGRFEDGGFWAEEARCRVLREGAPS